MARQMKESGIEWIGEIPEFWKRTKLLNLLRQSICDGPHETPILIEEGIPFISIDSLNSSEHIDFSKCKKYISENDYQRYYEKANLEEGDVLFTKAATIGKTAIVGKEKFMVWSPIAIIKVNEQIVCNKYVYHLLNCFELIKHISMLGSYNTQINVGMRELEQAMVPFPPLPEQHRIAAFLDRKCAEIDAVIEKTKATIEEYKKLKQSVITEAVTKGIRGNRPMKDSGIEWLGCIPAEWLCTKLKQVWISVDSGVSVNAADFPTENTTQYGVLKTSCVSKFVFLPNEHKQVNDDEYSRVACPVKKDSLIVSRMNTPDLVGACGYVDKDYPNLFLPDRLWQISFSTEIATKYVWYYLNNQGVRAYISSLSTGTSNSMQNISKPQFGGITLAIPSVEEQQEIIAYLDEKCDELDTLTAKKTDLLTELETYKKSLIYEYVTGKKEVHL